MNYKEELTRAMNKLAMHPKTVFLGQGVLAPGTFMSTTLEQVPKERRIELPVMEESQMGMSIGLAIDGMIPISIYPRYNFIVSAMSQLVNHVNTMRPRMIIRVGIGSTKPLDPGPQHKGDFTEAFKMLLPNIRIIKLTKPEQIVPEYMDALTWLGPTMLVEEADLYEQDF